jgi:transposase
MGAMSKKQRTKRDFSPEFKVEAVRLVKSGERKQAEVCRSLGVGSSTLSKWCNEASSASSGETKEESAKIKALEAEVRRLRLEQDILKKAAAYFARSQM